MKLKFLAVIVALAIGWVGLAPLIACAMPPDCPMQQQTTHPCCAPIKQTPPCSVLEMIVRLAQWISIVVLALILNRLFPLIATPRPLAAVRVAPVFTFPVPRFLLIKSLRL